jgi:hypothetical protein
VRGQRAVRRGFYHARGIIATIMSAHGGSNRGKWLAGTLVAIGVIAALAGLKFRVFTPRAETPPLVTPPTGSPSP